MYCLNNTIWHFVICSNFSSQHLNCSSPAGVRWETCQGIFPIFISMGCSLSLGYKSGQVRVTSSSSLITDGDYNNRNNFFFLMCKILPISTFIFLSSDTSLVPFAFLQYASRKNLKFYPCGAQKSSLHLHDPRGEWYNNFCLLSFLIFRFVIFNFCSFMVQWSCTVNTRLI